MANLDDRVKLLEWVENVSRYPIEELFPALDGVSLEDRIAAVKFADITKLSTQDLAKLARKVQDYRAVMPILDFMAGDKPEEREPAPNTAFARCLLLDPTEQNLFDWADYLGKPPTPFMWRMVFGAIYEEALRVTTERATAGHPASMKLDAPFELSPETELALLRVVPKERDTRRAEIFKVMRVWRLSSGSADHVKAFMSLFAAKKGTAVPEVTIQKMVNHVAKNSYRPFDHLIWVPHVNYFKAMVDAWALAKDEEKLDPSSMPPADVVRKYYPEYVQEYNTTVNVVITLSR